MQLSLNSRERRSNVGNSNGNYVLNTNASVCCSESLYTCIHGESFLFQQVFVNRPMELAESLSFYCKVSKRKGKSKKKDLSLRKS